MKIQTTIKIFWDAAFLRSAFTRRGLASSLACLSSLFTLSVLAQSFEPRHDEDEIWTGGSALWARYSGDTVYTGDEASDYIESLFELLSNLVGDVTAVTNPTDGAVDEDLNSATLTDFLEYEVERMLVDAEGLRQAIEDELDHIDRMQTLVYQSYDLKLDFGAAGDGVTNDYLALKRALWEIQEAGEPAELFIPAGEYYLNGLEGDRQLYRLSEVEDLTIRGETGPGGELKTLLTLGRDHQFMTFRNCSNVQIRELTVDFDPPPFSQGIVESVVNSGSSSVKMAVSLFPDSLDPSADAFITADQYRIWPIDYQTGLWAQFTFNAIDLEYDGTGNADVSYDSANDEYDFVVEKSDYQKYYSSNSNAVGDYVAIVPRHNNGVQEGGITSRLSFFWLKECSMMTFADLRVFSSQKYLVEMATGSRIDGLKLIRVAEDRMPYTSRFASGVADGVTGHDMARGPYVESCRFESIGDDGFNFSSRWWEVDSYSGNEVVVDYNNIDLYPEEGMVVIFDNSDGSGATENDFQAYGFIMAREAVTVGGDTMIKLTLDRDVSSLSGNSYLLSLAYNNVGAVVRNSFFGFNRANGCRVRSPNHIVENNVFAHSSGNSILVEWDFDSLKGFYPSNTIIRDNTIYRNPASKSIVLDSGIARHNNVDVNPSGVGAEWRTGDGNTVKTATNDFSNEYDYWFRQHSGSYDPPVRLDYDSGSSGDFDLLDALADTRVGAAIWDAAQAPEPYFAGDVDLGSFYSGSTYSGSIVGQVLNPANLGLSSYSYSLGAGSPAWVTLNSATGDYVIDLTSVGSEYMGLNSLTVNLFDSNDIVIDSATLQIEVIFELVFDDFSSGDFEGGEGWASSEWTLGGGDERVIYIGAYQWDSYARLMDNEQGESHSQYIERSVSPSDGFYLFFSYDLDDYEVQGSDLTVQAKVNEVWTDVWTGASVGTDSDFAVDLVDASVDLTFIELSGIRFLHETESNVNGGANAVARVDDVILSMSPLLFNPHLSDDVYQAFPDEFFEFDIVGEVLYHGSNSLTYSMISGPGWASISSDGTVSGTPSSAAAGLYQIVAEVSDGTYAAEVTLSVYVNTLVASDDFESGGLDGGVGWESGSTWVLNQGGTGQNEILEIEDYSGNDVVHASADWTFGSPPILVLRFERPLDTAVTDGRLSFKWDVDIPTANPLSVKLAVGTETEAGEFQTVGSSYPRYSSLADAHGEPDNLEAETISLVGEGEVKTLHFILVVLFDDEIGPEGTSHVYIDDIEIDG